MNTMGALAILGLILIASACALIGFTFGSLYFIRRKVRHDRHVRNIARAGAH